MDERAILDHQFVVAAYAVTWVLQLGYLAWLGLKWRSEKRNAERKSARPLIRPMHGQRPKPAGHRIR